MGAKLSMHAGAEWEPSGSTGGQRMRTDVNSLRWTRGSRWEHVCIETECILYAWNLFSGAKQNRPYRVLVPGLAPSQA
jgi:hypothetical protein